MKKKCRINKQEKKKLKRLYVKKKEREQSDYLIYNFPKVVGMEGHTTFTYKWDE